MIDFVGRTRSPLEEMQNWNQYFSQLDAASQARWQNREARARYDEANRFNREAMASDAQYYSTNPMPDYTQDFAGMAPRNATPLSPTQPATAPAASANTTNLSGLPWPASRATPAQRSANDLPIVDMRGERGDNVRPVLYTQENFTRNPRLAAQLQAAQDRGEISIQIQRDAIGGVRGLLVFPATPRALTARGAPDPGIGPLRFRRDSSGAVGEAYLEHPSQTIDATANSAPVNVSELVAGGFNSPGSQPQTDTSAAPPTGRAPEVAQYLQSQGFTITSTVRSDNAMPGGHPEGNSIDVRGGASDVANVQAAIQGQYPDLPVQAMFIRRGQRFANGVTATADHIHVDLGPAAQGGSTGTTQLAGGMYGQSDPTADQFFSGLVDASIAMRPTAEMQQAQAIRDRMYNRARIAASHGQMAQADAAFASAMQMNAAYIAASRQALLHAASAGNMDAAANLVAQSNGYDPSEVRFVPTDERRTRFQLQVRQGEQWVNTQEIPHSRDQWVEALTSFVDAEGAQHAREASDAMWRNINDNNTRLQIAQGEQGTALLRMVSDQAIAQFTERTRAAIQAGRAQIASDGEGGVYVITTQTDESGRQYPHVEHAQMEQVPSPTTDNRRATTNVLTVTNNDAVTGTVGTRAGAR